MHTRPAEAKDAPAMADIQNANHALGLRHQPTHADEVLARYITDPDRLACTVAVDGNGGILGFQSLKHARVGNPYEVTPDWGVIGTHIHPRAHRQGIGRTLFKVSVTAARQAGLRHIDATIGATNAGALAYYGAAGFVRYREHDGAICKRYDL